MSETFCATHQIEWNVSHDEECPCCRMDRELAAAIGQRDFLMNRNAELQDDLSAANQARASLQAAIARVKAWKQHTSVSMIRGEMVHHDCQCIECKTMRRIVAELEAV